MVRRKGVYISLLVLLLLAGCEVIAEQDRLIPVTDIPAGERGHVLIEFTGFRCVNCPTAAETAAGLQTLYGDKLIVVAMHPASNPFTNGLYDYTCPEADSVYRLLGGTSQTPFPTGNIDLRQRDKGYLSDPTEWPALVRQAMSEPASVESTARHSYWLVEDSVLGVQAMPDGTVNTAYYHRHVLRAISSQPIRRLPGQCNPVHCSVVTVITDKNEQYIINAYETKFTDSAAPAEP